MHILCYILHIMLHKVTYYKKTFCFRIFILWYGYTSLKFILSSKEALVNLFVIPVPT